MALDSVNLNLLVALIHLYEERSVTRAARRLGVSQSTMSYQLRRLRELFGDPLFVREGRGIVPTPRASDVIEQVRRGVSAIDEALAQPGAFEPARSTREFRLVSNDYFTTVALPSVLSAVRKLAPGVRIRLESYAADTLRDVEAGRADMLGGSQLHGSSTDLRKRRVYRDALVCVEAKRAREAPLDLPRYLASPHLAVRGPYPSFAEEALAEIEETRHVCASLPSYAGVLEAVLASDLIATVPLALVAVSPMACALAVHVPPLTLPPIDATLFWHPRYQGDPGLLWLRERVLETGNRVAATAWDRFGAVIEGLGRDDLLRP